MQCKGRKELGNQDYIMLCHLSSDSLDHVDSGKI